MARGAVQVSFGAGNTEQEVDQFINVLQATVGRLGTNNSCCLNNRLSGKTMKLPIYLDYSATTRWTLVVAQK